MSAQDSLSSSNTADYERLNQDSMSQVETSPTSFQTYGSIRSVEATSSVFEFPRENGRTYHSYRSGSYPYPNDTAECERLDLQHEIFKLIFLNRSHFAPLNSSQPLRVLDIGAGTGQWAIEIGDQYPNFQVQGVDLSPIQPTAVPPNVQFFIDDASESDWGVEAACFDYIHTRSLSGSFRSFKDVLQRAFYYLKPGGWMESHELMLMPLCNDGTMPADWPFLQWSLLWQEAAAQCERPLEVADKLKGWYEEVGFVDVHQDVLEVPIRGWRKSDRRLRDVGRLNEENILTGLSGFTMGPFSRALGWSQEQIEVYLVEVRKSIANRSIHAFQKLYLVWGKKPQG